MVELSRNPYRKTDLIEKQGCTEASDHWSSWITLSFLDYLGDPLRIILVSVLSLVSASGNQLSVVWVARSLINGQFVSLYGSASDGDNNDAHRSVGG